MLALVRAFPMLGPTIADCKGTPSPGAVRRGSRGDKKRKTRGKKVKGKERCNRGREPHSDASSQAEMQGWVSRVSVVVTLCHTSLTCIELAGLRRVVRQQAITVASYK